jgi:pimeloyl-ACP methyl ester carboxylesterase
LYLDSLNALIMKQIKSTIFFLALISCSSGIIYGQGPSYGSNSGKYQTIQNTKIYYEEYGSGSPLLLLHGGFGSIHDFQQVIPALAIHFRVIAIDSPGHGRSEQADSLSFDLMADYFSEMIDRLKLDSVFITGYSDGGISALLLATKRPNKVKRVIASGANSKMSGLVPQVLEYLSGVNPEFIENYQQEWLKDYQSKSPEKENWKKFVSDMTSMYSREETISNMQLSEISTRVMLVFGDKDVIKLEHGIEMYHAIPGSRFCVLPDTPHEVFSVKPELINEISIDFFQE